MTFSETSWMNEAACAKAIEASKNFAPEYRIYPEFWFAKDEKTTKRALAICATCMVQAECLQYALSNDLPFGVWGNERPETIATIKRTTRRRAYRWGSRGANTN